MNISVPLIIVILIIHYIGDWIAQTREQAEKKSSSNWFLATHVLSYGVFLWTAMSLIYCCFPSLTGKIHPFCLVNFIYVNMILHCITDYFTSRINARNWKKENKKMFWNGIGADQLIHQITLILTAWWLLA